MTFRLLPRDVQFFDLFVQDGVNLELAAGRLQEMLERFDRLDERIAEIQALEKRGDEIDREINRRLEDAFITLTGHEIREEAGDFSKSTMRGFQRM